MDNITIIDGEKSIQMKYANGCLYLKGKQIEAFICAKTYKRMIELGYDYGLDRSHFYIYWSKCGNDKMKEIAQDKEGIWVREEKFKDNWKPLSEILIQANIKKIK